MNDDLKIIITRIEPLFKRISRTHYWIEVVNDPYDQQFNFFFNSQKNKQRIKSIPLHSIATYKLAYLEKLIISLKSESKLTIIFVGFYNLKWPNVQTVIQRKRDILE